MAKTAADLVGAAKALIQEITLEDARQLKPGEAQFVDVREPPEWKDGTIDGAICVPRGVLEWKAESEDELKDKSAPLVVYCKSGGRSALAAQTLAELGYTNVKSLAGGYEAWSGKS